MYSCMYVTMDACMHIFLFTQCCSVFCIYEESHQTVEPVLSSYLFQGFVTYVNDCVEAFSSFEGIS